MWPLWRRSWCIQGPEKNIKRLNVICPVPWALLASLAIKLCENHGSQSSNRLGRAGLEKCLVRQTGDGKAVIGPGWVRKFIKTLSIKMVVYLSYNCESTSSKVYLKINNYKRVYCTTPTQTNLNQYPTLPQPNLNLNFLVVGSRY